MTAATASQRGAANRRRGATAERDVARYLRGHGWPSCERAVRAGFRTADRVGADPGDLTGTPGIVWSVKDCAVDQHRAWLAELDAMAGDPTCVRLLVAKRRGHADVGAWWCWLWQGQYLDLYRTWLEHIDGVRQIPELPVWQPEGAEYPLRVELGHLLPLLHAAGFGDPPSR